MASIVQVNISRGGLPKTAIDSGLIGALGIEGDLHAHPQFHGGPRKAILIIASETIGLLKQRGYPVFYGALGENLTTEGLDFRDLRLGDELRAGGAILEITHPRVPCGQLDVYGPSIKNEIFDKGVKALDPKSPRWGWSGFYASVRSPGSVAAGDIIEVTAKLA